MGKITGNSYVLDAQDIAAFTKRVRAESGETTLHTSAPLKPRFSDIAVRDGALPHINGIIIQGGKFGKTVDPSELQQKMAAAGNATITKEAEFHGKQDYYRISFGKEHIIVRQTQLPEGVLAKVKGLDAKMNFEVSADGSVKQKTGPSVVAEAAAHPSPKTSEAPVLHFGNNSPGRGLSEALNTKIDPQSPPTMAVPEALKDIEGRLGRASDDAHVAQRKSMESTAAGIKQQIDAGLKAGPEGESAMGLVTRMLGGVGGDMAGLAKNFAGIFGGELKDAERGIGAAVRNSTSELKDIKKQMEEHGRGVREAGRSVGERLDNQGPAGGRKDLGDKMPWLEQKSETGTPPIPQGRPERQPEQRGEAAPKAMSTARVAAVAQESLAAPQGAKVAPPRAETAKVETATAKTPQDRPAAAWSGKVEPFDPKIKEAQEALAKDPKYKEMLTCPSGAVCDGLKGPRTVATFKQFALDNGLDPQKLTLGDLIKQAQAKAPVPAAFQPGTKITEVKPGIPAKNPDMVEAGGNPYIISDPDNIGARDHMAVGKAKMTDYATTAAGSQYAASPEPASPGMPGVAPQPAAPAVAPDPSMDAAIKASQQMHLSSMG